MSTVEALLLVLSLCVVGCAARPMPARPAPPFAAVVGPVIVAHRGGALEVPENTLEAVQHGVAVGSDWQEIDVGLSLDEEVVVFHDDTLERTTDGEGPFEQKTLAELKELSAGRPAWAEGALAMLSERGIEPVDFGERFKDARIPTLAEVLAINEARLMIEMKRTERGEKLVEGVIDTVYELAAADRVALASFDDELLYLAYTRDPSLPLIGIANSVEGIERMAQLPLTALAVRADLATTTLEMVSPSVAVWVWTAYSVDEGVGLRDLGVHGIITDVPAALVEAMRGEIDLTVEMPE